MRDAFFDELYDLFCQDRRVVFLTGDLGYKLFDRLTAHDPERVINCGIRESGMIGYAAGLAAAGMLPFVYSITPFATLRCLEQIKIDLCYNRATVVIVGVGGGYAYGPNGPTHHGIDDIGTLSCLPGLNIWTPCDPHEVRLCVRAASGMSGPSYLRLGRNGEPLLHPSFEETPDIFSPSVIREGNDGLIIVSGFILDEVLQAAAILNRQGIFPRIVRITAVRPFPEKQIKELLQSCQAVLSVEEHVSSGGIGFEVARIIAEGGSAMRYRMLTAPNAFPDACYDRSALLRSAGIDSVSIANSLNGLLALSPAGVRVGN